MKYSLRSLMIVAILGPAAIAASYFVTRWLMERQSPPPLVTPGPPPVTLP